MSGKGNGFPPLSEFSDSTRIWYALEHLKYARDALKMVECPNTLARVRSAIESCEGALRNQSARNAAARSGTPRRVITKAKRRNLHTREMATLSDPYGRSGADKTELGDDFISAYDLSLRPRHG